MGFGSAVQHAAFVLSDYLEHYCYDSIKDKYVLELGTGPGLVSITASLLGAQRVLATDGDVKLLQLTERNISENVRDLFERGVISTKQLLWGETTHYDQISPPVDVLLGADIIACPYEHDFENLVQTIRALTDERSLVLLSYRRRSFKEDACFEMLKQFFHVKMIDQAHVHADFRESDICIFELQRLE